MRERAWSWLDQRAEGAARVIAARWRRTAGRRTTLIAVTGSFGKSTTTRAIAAALGEGSDREVFTNAYASLYFHMIRMTGRRSHCVLEVGIGNPDQMRRHAGALRPDVAVVTAVGAEHVVAFPDGLDGIQREKGELVASLTADGTAVLNADDPRVMAMAARTNARVLTYGRAPGADVRLLELETRMDGSRLSVGIEGRTYTLEVRLVGHTAASAILAAITAVHACGHDLREAVTGLEALLPTPRRLEPVVLPGGIRALLDDYKGTPPTAHAAFAIMETIPGKRRVGVLGGIPVTMEGRERAFRELGEHAGRVFDRIYLSCLDDGEATAYEEGLALAGFPEDRITRLPDVHEAARVLGQELEHGDVVLFKAHFSDKISRTILLMRGLPVRCRRSYCLIRGSEWCDACPAVFKATS